MASLESLRRNREFELVFGIDVNNPENNKTYLGNIGKIRPLNICIGSIEYDYKTKEIKFKEFENCDKNYETECNGKRCYRK